MAARHQMTRAHYETLSAVFADTQVDDDARRTLAFEMADALVGTSERFDPVRWLRQCDVGPVTDEIVSEYSARLRNRVQSINALRAAAAAREGK